MEGGTGGVGGEGVRLGLSGGGVLLGAGRRTRLERRWVAFFGLALAAAALGCVFPFVPAGGPGVLGVLNGYGLVGGVNRG